MKNYRPCSVRIYLLITGVALWTCHPSIPRLEEINMDQWKKDRYGCTGVRSAMIKAVTNQQKKLLRLTEMQIVTLFGRPDQSTLFEHNQKFYIYYLEPSDSCQNSLLTSKRLVLRFNGLGHVQNAHVH